MISKPPVSIEDKIYISGLLDGEGYFFICRGSKKKSKAYYRCGIKIAMVDDSGTLPMARDIWGGYIVKRLRRSIKHRATIEWIIDGNCLDKFLPDIIPYLRLKKQQAEILQEFRKFVSYNNNITQSVIDYRNHLFLGLKGLHHSIPFVIDPEIRDKAKQDIVTKRFISIETRNKLSLSHKGKHHAGTYKKGVTPWITGKKHSEETKRKIGEANSKARHIY